MDLLICQNNYEYDLDHFAVPLQTVMLQPEQSANYQKHKTAPLQEQGAVFLILQ